MHESFVVPKIKNFLEIFEEVNYLIIYRILAFFQIELALEKRYLVGFGSMYFCLFTLPTEVKTNY